MLAYPEAPAEGFDIDEASVDQAKRNAAEMGVSDRVTFHDRDAAEAEPAGGFDLALAFECIHDMPVPVKVLDAMRRAVSGRGTAGVVVDERVEETFTAPAGPIDQLMYGASLLIVCPTACRARARWEPGP